MFAVIRTGGKQYTVRSGDILRIEKAAGNPGENITFSEVLMLGGDKPVLGSGAVTAEVLRHGRADKVLIFKKKRRHNYRRTKGHRQYFTEVKITAIQA